MALESRHKPLVIQNALAKLRDSSIVIDRRGGLDKHEGKRVAGAATILENGPPEPGSKGEKNRTKYWKFLQKMYELSGRPMVNLVAAALGLTAVANMKERTRLDLPYEVDAIKEELLNPTLLHLAYRPNKTNDSAHQVHPTTHQSEEQDTTRPHLTSLTAYNPTHTITLKQLPSVSLNLQLRDLVEFLQQCQASNQQLQMECPFIGDPLPFIRFTFGQQADLHATLEFSQPLATIFIQYVMNRRAE